MKQRLINYARKHVARPYVDIEEGDGSLIFKIRDKVPFSTSSLIFKHRRTGKGFQYLSLIQRQY